MLQPRFAYSPERRNAEDIGGRTKYFPVVQIKSLLSFHVPIVSFFQFYPLQLTALLDPGGP
jgi:hypothetical protein